MNRANFEIRVREKLRSSSCNRNYFEAQVTLGNGRRWTATSGSYPGEGSRDSQFGNLLEIVCDTLKKQHATHETAESEGQSQVA